jgi:hypothetical protein
VRAGKTEAAAGPFSSYKFVSGRKEFLSVDKERRSSKKRFLRRGMTAQWNLAYVGFDRRVPGKPVRIRRKRLRNAVWKQ